MSESFQTRRVSGESGSAAVPADAPLVVAQDICVAFRNQTVLRHLSLRVHRGETVAIIGESGCGKTVFLKSLIGLITPDQGVVEFDGNDLKSTSESDLAQLRSRIGFVFQDAALFDSMTVGQNVAFPLRQHRKMEPDEIRELVLERLAEVGLPDTVARKKPVELSGGMRKRVGLARALILHPELILYDEPTTGLDPIVGDVINELIVRTSRQRPVTSIIVTHDMRTALKVADRVVMFYPLARLAEGESQILFDGPPEALDSTEDRRVRQFVRGEAGERLMELRSEPR